MLFSQRFYVVFGTGSSSSSSCVVDELCDLTIVTMCYFWVYVSAPRGYVRGTCAICFMSEVGMRPTRFWFSSEMACLGLDRQKRIWSLAYFSRRFGLLRLAWFGLGIRHKTVYRRCSAPRAGTAHGTNPAGTVLIHLFRTVPWFYVYFHGFGFRIVLTDNGVLFYYCHW